jgi:peptidoglycan/LPS O-acetylase OafA/YrhL
MRTQLRVSIFFFVSGFLITTLMRAEHEEQFYLLFPLLYASHLTDL